LYKDSKIAENLFVAILAMCLKNPSTNLKKYFIIPQLLTKYFSGFGSQQTISLYMYLKNGPINMTRPAQQKQMKNPTLNQKVTKNIKKYFIINQ